MDWRSRVDVGRLGEGDRRRLLAYAVDKYGKKRVLEALGVSRSTLHRMLSGKVGISDRAVAAVLGLLSREEFEAVVGVEEALRAAGVVGEDGHIDYGLAFKILSLAARDEYLKQAIIRFVVEAFREDVKRALGLYRRPVVLVWEPGFEEYLRTHKRRRRVQTEETMKYYRSLFKKYLEGRRLDAETVEFVVSHPNRWLRNVFRHYVQYLYHKRMISGETLGWITQAVPARNYERRIRVYAVRPREVAYTLRYLAENNEEYYLVYALMYFSGARFTHVLRVIAGYAPDEVVEVEALDAATPRLTCFPDEGFCRYYAGYRSTQKPCEWIWFPARLLSLLEKYGGSRISRYAVTKYAGARGLVQPKYMRKINWQLITKIVPDKDVARFIHSRLGEIPASEARYGNLLAEADAAYPEIMAELERAAANPEYMRAILFRPTWNKRSRSSSSRRGGDN